MSNHPPPAKRRRLSKDPTSSTQLIEYGGPSVKVAVGNGNNIKTFTLQPSVLTKSSKFFQTRLKPEWNESCINEVMLPDHSPTTFNIYVHWLYTNALALSLQGNRSILHLSRAYVLGEYLLDLKYQDTVMHALLECFHSTTAAPSYTAITTIYEGTPERSPARRLFVEFWCWYAHSECTGIKNLVQHAPLDFAADLCAALVEKRERPRDARAWVLDPDSYLLGEKEDVEKANQVER